MATLPELQHALGTAVASVGAVHPGHAGFTAELAAVQAKLTAAGPTPSQTDLDAMAASVQEIAGRIGPAPH